MRTSLHEHDPMGWSFETFRTPRLWTADKPRRDTHRLNDNRLFRGAIVGAGALLIALLIAQSIPAGQTHNVIAAWLAAGGLVFATVAIDASDRTRFGALALAGVTVVLLASLGLGAAGWLAAAAALHAAAGALAARATPYTMVFTAWAWFHALLGLLLVI